MTETESWVSPANGSWASTRHSIIRSNGTSITVTSGHYASVGYPCAVQVLSGITGMSLDVDTARELGRALIAAADHYEAQVLGEVGVL